MTQLLVGDIVKARGREWVIQPGSTDGLVRVQPLGGNPQEATVILRAVEEVNKATFAPPDPEFMGDHGSAWIMRAAARIGNPNATGPFRCLGRIGVQPRPYQYVPLLMALRQEPVRLLIADDVGVGKTVEALLIARELMDRGEIEGFSVLCPPHLAEQWQEEIKDKFHLDAVLYTAKTADKIHRNLAVGESPFKRHPVTVVSMDYAKQETRRDTFLHHAPRFIIVDEAHTATTASDSKHMRYELVKRLGADKDRHMVLVTATPHTGSEDAFRRMLGLLDPDLESLPANLTGEHNRRHRERLAAHMVQRRRGDLAEYMEGTHFPELLVKEASYQLHPKARELLVNLVDAARSQFDSAKGETERRIHWWSLLSMVRAFASSPRALAATLAERNRTASADSASEANRRGRDAFSNSADDVTEGAGVSGEYSEWIDEAEVLSGAKDRKLKEASKAIKELLGLSRGVIVFCQFIETAEYVADYLRSTLKVPVEHVTGKMDPEDRRQRIKELNKQENRILVATDCLSEGINLQEGFDAVFHYDLAWNPTRHEQREGRVDRYGQKSQQVRSILYYGTDNLIDGIVLDVLLRKHESIRSSTGVRVPVPRNHADVSEAIMESLLLRRRSSPAKQTTLHNYIEDVRPLHTEWERRGEREKRSRTLFAQASIKDQDVAEAIKEAQGALGAQDVSEFVQRCLTHRHIDATMEPKVEALLIRVDGMDDEVRHALDLHEDKTVRFEGDPTKDGEYLHRSHPLVQNLSQFAIETAIDELVPGPAARCSTVVTRDVKERTDVYVVRFRYRMRFKATDRLIEEIAVFGSVEGKLKQERDLGAVLEASPAGNLDREMKMDAVRTAVASLEELIPRLQAEAEKRCREAKRIHERVRDAAKLGLGRIELEVNGTPDILGAYVFLPKEAA